MSSPTARDWASELGRQLLRDLFPRVDPALSHFVWHAAVRNLPKPAADRAFVIDAIADYAIELVSRGEMQAAVEMAELARVAQLAALGDREALALFGVGAEWPPQIDPTLLRVVRRVLTDLSVSPDAVLLLADALREAAGELRLDQRPAQAAQVDGLAQLIADAAAGRVRR